MKSIISKSILIVDDDKDILEFLSYNIRQAGYKVFTALNGEEGLSLVKKIEPSMVLLDVMMPVMDGIESCREIRLMPLSEQPIIAILSSRSEEYSQIAGLEAGADDYITKPIKPRLLLKKIESLFRRIEHGKSSAIKVSKNGINIDRERYKASKDGMDIYLPKKEFELLDLLMSKPGKVFNRDQIMSLIWGDDTIVGERTVDVHIRKLREKIGDNCVRTIKGVGYTFNDL